MLNCQTLNHQLNSLKCTFSQILSPSLVSCSMYYTLCIDVFHYYFHNIFPFISPEDFKKTFYEGLEVTTASLSTYLPRCCTFIHYEIIPALIIKPWAQSGRIVAIIHSRWRLLQQPGSSEDFIYIEQRERSRLPTNSQITAISIYNITKGRVQVYKAMFVVFLKKGKSFLIVNP